MAAWKNGNKKKKIVSKLMSMKCCSSESSIYKGEGWYHSPNCQSTVELGVASIGWAIRK